MRRIGIDLGGHTISAALVESEDDSASPRIVRKISDATPKERRVADVMAMMADFIAQLTSDEGGAFAKSAGVAIPGIVDADRRHTRKLANFPRDEGEGLAKSAGVAVPGMVDADHRHARRLPNFPRDEWDNLDVPAALESALRARGLNLPIKIENDANCYAFGEGSAGEAVGSKDYVVFTLGTGIGGGIVLGGKLIAGFHGMAGEPGHIVVAGDAPCGCGGKGHLETIAAADGTSKRAALAGLPEDFRALWALRGDPKADAVIEPGLDALARAIATTCHMLDPEMIILGGGMSRALDIREALHARTLPYLSHPFRDKLDLRVSKLGEEAALYGAACI